MRERERKKRKRGRGGGGERVRERERESIAMLLQAIFLLFMSTPIKVIGVVSK